MKFEADFDGQSIKIISCMIPEKLKHFNPLMPGGNKKDTHT